MFRVHKRYESKQALVDITLDIADNEFMFISGPSGAGKSTLLKLIYLGEKVTDGQIIVDGLNLARITRGRLPFFRRKFGIVFQDYKLIPGQTVFENIALVVEAVGTKPQLVKKKVFSLLRTVGMEERHKAFPPSLSGGEQQRVAVARAIAGNPKIIIADEPTASLDAESADVVMDLLKQYHHRGATVIIASHDTELIRNTGGRIVLLKGGYLDTSTFIPRQF
jgi:cell division transport system ATP-binding protein